MKKNGALVISLDFELFWGMADFGNAQTYRNTIENVHNVVPKLLDMFKEYGIHATWATVGAIFAHNDEEFLEHLPAPIAPQTLDMLYKLGILPEKDETKCPRSMLFAPELVKLISETQGQELGTHTYSHYYCDLKSSKPEEFSREISSAKAIMGKNGYNCKSIVFPRNQVHAEYADAAANQGVCIYRGVESGKLQQAKNRGKKGLIMWYGDNYIPIQRCQSYGFEEIEEAGKLHNVRNTRFFKPFRPKYRLLEKLKLWRYKSEMRRAAKRGEIYHMYWHPHNFAENTDINFRQMDELLSFYLKMKDKYGMASLNMNEAADFGKTERT